MAGLAIVLMLLAASSPARAEARLRRPNLADPPAVHGMLLFGRKKIYLSHLPMFHKPHDYQAIFEASLPADAARRYREDAAAHPGETVYTLVPEPFVLPAMAAHPKRFKATIFRGHFERGGVPLLETEATIQRVIHFRKFEPGSREAESSGFLLFGQPGEAYAAHYIVRPPDFDQIAEISASDPALLASDRPAAPGDRKDGPLQDGERIGMGGATFTAGRELYLEFGDLSE